MEPHLGTTFKFGDLELDLPAYELRRRGRRVRIERIPMELLILLVERNGDLVSRAEIVDRLWGNETFLDAESGVNTAVRKVREALKDNPSRPMFIQTVSGKGYRFCGAIVSSGSAEAGVSASFASEPSIQSAAPAEGANAAEPVPRTVFPSKFMIMAVASVGLLVIPVIIFFSDFLRGSRLSTPITVALLPFENLTGDPNQDYLSDGLTEETIAVLGKVNPSRMTVIARTTTMAYKRHTKTARQIGNELGADYLLEGGVRREGQSVRVTARLIRVRDQAQVWSEHYDRFGSGVIQIQDELGSAIAQQIQIGLLPEEGNQRKQTRMLDAYDPYLLGRHFWSQIRPDAIRKSIEYFQTAITKDPTYALAFAGLADAYTILPITGDASPREMWPLARDAASEAIRLNGSLAEAQAAGGYVDFWLEWNWGRSAERLRRAIQLNPNNASAHRYYAHLLSNSGRHAEAAAEIAKARHLDPFSPITNTMAGQFLFYSGRYPEAIEALNKAFSIDRDFWVAHIIMGRINERSGKPEAAIESLEKADNLSRGSTAALSVKGYVLAKVGRRAEAEELVNSLIETARNRFVPPSRIALIYAGLGNRESAFHWLDRAYEAHDVNLVFLPIDPNWDILRPDARFQELLTRCQFVLPKYSAQTPGRM